MICHRLFVRTHPSRTTSPRGRSLVSGGHQQCSLSSVFGHWPSAFVCWSLVVCHLCLVPSLRSFGRCSSVVCIRCCIAVWFLVLHCWALSRSLILSCPHTFLRSFFFLSRCSIPVSATLLERHHGRIREWTAPRQALTGSKPSHGNMTMWNSRGAPRIPTSHVFTPPPPTHTNNACTYLYRQSDALEA